MTLQKLTGMKLFALAIALFIAASFTNEVAKAAYPPLPTWAYGCMTIQSIRIMDGATPIYNSTVTGCNQRDRTADPVQATSIKLESGKTYNIICAGLCYGGNSCYYGGKIGAWIDFNGNQSYADAGERVMWNYWGTSYNTNITGSFTVPSVAEGKVFRMIFSSQYYYYTSNYGYYNVDPMYTGNHSPGYGDRACIDFYVENPALPNAGAVSIVQPSGAMTKGTQNIAVRIQNYDSMAPLTSCRIIWRIDEGQLSQVSNTYNWTGNLAYNATTDVVVGSFNFNENRTYTIDAFTEFPNGKNDTDPSNDRCIRRTVAPALSPDNYYIGAYPGSSNTFATITDATNYLSAAGLIGDGTMNIIFPTANPGPAVFTGPIIVGAYPSVGNNTVAFRSESGNPADVIINFTPDVTTPYLLSMSNLKNTSIKGITFNTTTGVTNSGIINLSNCQGVSIEDNLFLNKVGAGLSTDFVSVNLSNCYDITVKNNEFRNGSIAIYEIGQCPRKLEFSYNTIKDYSWVGIQVAGNATSPCAENIVKIDTNKFSGTNIRMGISSTNGTEITRNQFNGYTGVSPTDAVIYITNNDPVNFTNSTLIDNNILTSGIVNIHGIYALNVPKLNVTNNKIYTTDVASPLATNAVTIESCGSTSDPVYITKNEIKSGANGLGQASVNNFALSLTNSTARVNYNDIDLYSGGANVYSLYAINSSGYIANSQITSVEANGIYLNNSSLGFYYNSVANRSGIYPTVLLNSGTGIIRRNIFQNEGAGPVIIATSAAGNVIDENNYWSKNVTPTFGSWNGVNYSTLADWQTATGMDANSSAIEISFFDFDAQNLSLNTFDEALVFDDPIDFSAYPGYDAEIQQKDYLGQTRYSYFMGSENIVPEVFITNQPNGVMDCYGKTGYYIGVTAYVTRGVQARFEWYKDGKSLTELYKNPTDNWAEKASIYLDSLPFAAGNPGLNYDMEGTYRCLVRGSGAEPKWSNSVLVNALSDAEITREPEDVRVDIGGTAILEVEAHIVADEGIDDPLYQPEVQWYFARNNQPVVNDLDVDGHYTGAKSTILTIRNIDDVLLTTPLQDGVYCVLKGSCNTLTSKTAFVKLFPQVFINQDPANVTPCEGAAATFRVTATSSDPEATLEYQWRKDGVAIPGATTNTYNIAAASAGDVGEYDCVVTVIPGGKTETSAKATLTLLAKVAITTQPTAQTVAAGNPFSLFVTATGEAPLSYQWQKDNVDLPGATQETYSVASATLSDAGVYTCKVTNVCGTVTTDPVTVTVTTGGIVDVTDYTADGFGLVNNVPNPFSETSKIKFFAPQTSYVRLAITDVYGKEVAVLVDGNVNGWNEVEVNASALKMSSGVYYYTLTSNNNSVTKKMIVVR